MKRFMKWWKNLNPPVKWLFYFIAGMLTLSFLFAPQPQPVDLEKVNFTTQAGSRLYFKNVRSYYYYINPREKAPFVLYRYKRRLQDSSGYHLPFLIIENPKGEEAYIFAEASEDMLKLEDPTIHFEAGVKSFKLKEMNNQEHLILAARTYNALLKNEQIWLLNRSDTVSELYQNKVENANAEVVLQDYFKLINKK